MIVTLDGKKIDDLRVEDLRQLIQDRRGETRFIDYKSSLPMLEKPPNASGQTDAAFDKSKKEFLADVSSFSNSAGGYLVYGMKEKEGIPIDLCGCRGVNPDKVKLKLDEWLRNGIQPRLNGVQIGAVPIGTDTWAFVLRIPRSWNAPHRVYQDHFYGRSNAGKFQMDVDQLRDSFLGSATIAEKARAFRDHRADALMRGRSAIQVKGGGLLVFHFLPLESFGNPSLLDFSDWDQVHPLVERPMFDGGGKCPRHNFDGFLYTGGNPETDAYCQFFRSGFMEYVYQFSEESYPPNAPTRRISGVKIERSLRRSLMHALSASASLGLSAPAFIAPTLIGVEGWLIFAGEENEFRFHNSGQQFDRDPLTFPEHLLESFDQPVDRVLKSIADPIWNAAGWGRSPFFKDEKWTRPHQGPFG